MGWRAFGAGGAAASVVFLLAPTGGLLQALVFVVVNTAALVALAAGIRRLPGTPGVEWRVLLVAAGIYWVANVGWSLYPVLGGRPLPFPSVLDPMYWLAYLGWLVFLVIVIRRRSVGDSGAILDVLIVAAGISVLGWELLLEPVIGNDLPVPVLLTSATYPIVLTAVTAAALRAAVAPARAGTAHMLMVGWIGFELSADVWYSLASAAGTFRFGDPASVLWLLSYTLLGAAALHPDFASMTSPADVERPISRRARLVMLGVAGSLPLAAVAVDLQRSGRPGTLWLVGIGAAILVTIVARLGRLVGDLAEQARLRTELEHASLHDQLTGLANRTAFNRALRRALAVRHGSDRTAMVLLVDLDKFKSVNDTYGHEAGDELLRRIAARLGEGLRPADTVARLGGDEFAVVIDDIAVEEGFALADRLTADLSEPVELGPATPAVGVSLGLYLAQPGDSADDAVRHADAAMYAAKTAGGGLQVFDEARHRRFLDRYRLDLQLRAAPAAGELHLDYQPIFRLDDSTVVAAEALLRWRHPERGWLPLEAFLELANTSGAILHIGRWALEQACRDAASWQDVVAGRDDWRGVAVNMSHRQLESSGIVADVADALVGSGLPPSLLTLEVTEVAFPDDIDDMLTVFDELEALGIGFAMDGFGTATASLADLKRVPIDVVKIDPMFVVGIAGSAERTRMAAAIVSLAASLGKRTLAMGVNDTEHVAHLHSLGCELGQGALVPPLTAEEIFEELRDGTVGGRR